MPGGSGRDETDGQGPDDEPRRSGPHAELEGFAELAHLASTRPLSPIPDIVPPAGRDFAESLRVLFGGTGVSLNQLAAMLHLNPGTLSRYLSGDRIPPPDFIDRLYGVLYDLKGSLITQQTQELVHEQFLAALEERNPALYKIQRLTDQLRTAVEQKRRYERLVAVLEEEIASRNDRITELELQGRQLQSAPARAEEDLGEGREERERLRRGTAELRMQVRELKEQLRSTQQRTTAAEKRCRELEAQLESAGARLHDEGQAPRGPEWPLDLDVPALLADGWQPAPFTEFVVNIHSRCDLACDYCYMYEMADQSWRDQPRRMSRGIAEAAASRIGEHARQHGLREIALVLHGGEPLLAGKELIWSLVTAVGRAAGSGVQVRARIQTNGVGLSDDYLRLLDELKVRVQVSLDGGADQHDRHRRFASGRGSYAAVAAGLDRLRKPHYGHLFGGLLCTVDVRNDPVATYEALLAFDPPAIDFQLPHGTWEAPPPGRGQQPRHTPYADWLIAVFDRWYRNRGTSVPMFESVMSLLLLGSSSVQSVGMAPSTVVVIETDGSVRQTDSLKGTYHGASASELHVIRDPLDAALLLPGFAAQQIGEKALAPQCLTCPIHHVCGGGQYSHRYRPGSGFANPSVYCPDLMKLIGHIAEIIREDVTFRRDHDG